jgi:hypothetical protein
MIAATNLKGVLSQLKGVKEYDGYYMALCPCHDDHSPSLKITPKGDQIYFDCKAGCDWKDIKTKLGCDSKPTPQKRIIATYDYTDESGKLIFQKVRYEPKDFRCRVPDGSGWSYKLNGCRKVLYNLPELIKDNIAFVCEGEKDCDCLISKGYAATCNFDGAGKWLPDYNQYFAGKMVYICGDNDTPGRNHVRLVFDNIKPVAGSIQIVQIPSPHKDVSDYFAAGGTVDGFNKLVAEAVDTIPDGWATIEKPVADTEDLLPLIDLSSLSPKAISWLWHNRFVNKGLNIIAGHGEAGKTTFSAYLMGRITTGQDWFDCKNTVPAGSCVYIGAEDDLDSILLPKLIAAGADTRKIKALNSDKAFPDGRYFNLADHLDYLDRTIAALGDVRAVFFDPLNGYMGKININDDNGVRSVLIPMQNMAKRWNITIFGLCHLNKKGDSPAFDRIIGSVAFREAARSVWYITRDKETDTRYFTKEKSNYCINPTNLSFQIVDNAVAFNAGTTDKTADDILQSGRQKSDSTVECANWLRKKLQFNSAESKEIEQQARAEGFTEYALREAKRTLKVNSKKDNFGGKWRLYLPENDGNDK